MFPIHRFVLHDHHLATHMEVVPLSLELGGGVHLVGHDARDGLKEKFNFVDNLPTCTLSNNQKRMKYVFKYIFPNMKDLCIF